MQRLSVTALGAAFIALGTIGTAPATAALLYFDFTTESGSTGSFTLNTDTTASPDPVIFFNDDGSVFEGGFEYPNAVSNLSISAPYINLSNVETDYGVYTIIPFAPGVQSAATLPSGCNTSTTVTCGFSAFLVYSGSVANLPVLSDDPLSYSTGLGILLVDSQTGELLERDSFTDFQVQAVPESGSILGTLAFAVGGASLLLRHKMNRKKVAIRPS